MTKKERVKRLAELAKAQFIFNSLLGWGITYLGIQLGETCVCLNAEASCTDEAERIKAFITACFPKLDEIKIDEFSKGYRVLWIISFAEDE